MSSRTSAPLYAAWTPARDVRAGDVISWQGRSRQVVATRPGTSDPAMVRGLQVAGVPTAVDVFTVYLPGEALFMHGRTPLPVVGVARRVP